MWDVKQTSKDRTPLPSWALLAPPPPPIAQKQPSSPKINSPPAPAVPKSESKKDKTNPPPPALDFKEDVQLLLKEFLKTLAQEGDNEEYGREVDQLKTDVKGRLPADDRHPAGSETDGSTLADEADDGKGEDEVERLLIDLDLDSLSDEEYAAFLSGEDLAFDSSILSSLGFDVQGVEGEAGGVEGEGVVWLRLEEDEEVEGGWRITLADDDLGLTGREEGAGEERVEGLREGWGRDEL